jgi:phosphoesterase RecJ-like protein
MNTAAAEQIASRKVELPEVIEVLRRSDNILIVSHMRPDGDCLGSTVGLFLILKALGKRVAAYNSSSLGDKWDFLHEIGNVRQGLPDWPISLTVFVDCGAVTRVHDDFVPHGMTLNIDHHLTNECYGDLNWIDIDACAVGEQIYAIMRGLQVPLTSEIASALYLSIMTDTGGFRYSNTTPRAFQVAGELVAGGADAGALAQAVYENRTRGEVALAAIAMQRLNYVHGGAGVWAELSWADYEANGGLDSEPEGLVGEMRAIKGVEASLLLHETEDGWLRAGFRGKGRVNCSAIAVACGGGGHFNASGAHVRRPYNEAKAFVLEQFLKGLANDLPEQ